MWRTSGLKFHGRLCALASSSMVTVREASICVLAGNALSCCTSELTPSAAQIA
ncbi:hypothetical protein D3C83_309710 [compost metagenome]